MTVTASDIDVPLQALFDRTAVLVPRVRLYKATAAGIAIPALCLYIDAAVVGGGGGGASGAGPGNNNGGCGGGSGYLAQARIMREDVGDTLDVTIGAGGAGGAGGVTGATNANVGASGGLSAVKFNGPTGAARDFFVQAAGGIGGQLTAGGAGYSGGGGAGEDASGAGAGGSLGGAGQSGAGGAGRAGGAGVTAIGYLSVHTGAGCRGGDAGSSTGFSFQTGGGGGGGPLTDDASGGGASASNGTGAQFTEGGFGGRGYGAGGGGGGQGLTSSGAGGDGQPGVVQVTFWCGVEI